MKKSMVFLVVGVLMLAGIAGAQCVVVRPAAAPCATVAAAPGTPVMLTTGYYMTTRPATPVLVGVPTMPCVAAEEVVEEEAPSAEITVEEVAVEAAPEAEVAVAAPCAVAAPVVVRPATLRRRMVCTSPVSVSSTDTLTGRPYTVTRRISCRPRSIYYWE